MLGQSSSDLRPSSVTRIRSTVIVRPRGTLFVSVTTVASPASIRPASIPDDTPWATTSTLPRRHRAEHGEYFEGTALFATQLTFSRGRRHSWPLDRPPAGGRNRTPVPKMPKGTSV